MMFRQAWVLVTVLIMSFSIPVLFDDDANGAEGPFMSGSTASTTHTGFPPISIEDDFSLYENASLNGWTGTGTVNDPILISNLDFDSNGTTYALSISNTTMHVKFVNCIFRNTTLTGQHEISGLSLVNNTMIHIEDCNFTDSLTGLYAMDSSISVSNSTFISNVWSGLWGYDSDCQINESLFTDNEKGLYLQNSPKASITGNNFTDNDLGAHIESSPNSSVTNNFFDGQNTQAVEVMISDDVILRNNTYLSNPIGLYLENSDRFYLDNETVSGGRLGVSIFRCEDSIMSNSSVTGVLDTGVYLYNSVKMWNFTSNVISNCPTGIGFMGFSASSYNTVYNNLIQGSSRIGVQIYVNHFWNNIISNTIRNCPTGIRLDNNHNNLIMNNVIGSSAESGVYIYNSRYNVVDGNDISDSLEESISIIRGGDNSVTSNILGYNSIAGVYVENSNNNVIISNKIHHSQTGIEDSFADYTEVSENHITDCVHGILFRGGDFGILDNNTIMDSTSSGITLSESNDNLLFNNTIMKCKFFGMNMLSSSRNTVIANALAYNNKAGYVFNSSARQAQDNFETNVYNHDGRGNYWRDHTTPDTDQDGIVDTSYQLAGLIAYDLYPLTTTDHGLVPSVPENVSAQPYPGSVDISWDPAVYDGGEAIQGYHLYRANSSGKFMLISSQGPGSVSFRDIDLLNGMTYSYYLAAFNIIGEGPGSSKVSATPDNTVPQITILSPTEGSFLNEREVMVTWKGLDIQNNIVDYQIRLDMGEWIDAGASNQKSVIVDGNGPHMITVKGIDKAGNLNETSVNFTMDREMPLLSIIEPADGGWINTTSLYINWTMSDKYSGVRNVEARWDDVYWIDKGLATEMTIKNLDAGSHLVYLKVFDIAGNEYLQTINVSIDLEAPQVWIEFPENDTLTNDPQFWFKWVGMDLESGTSSFFVKIDEENWTDVGKVYNKTVDLGEEGDHVVYLMIMDIAGNQEMVSLKVTLDLTSPVVVDHGPTGTSVDPSKAKIFATVSEFLDPNNMVFTINGLPGPTIWTADRTVVLTPADGLIYGTTYDIEISGTDFAGNLLETFGWSFSTDDRGYIKGRVIDSFNFPVKTAIVTVADLNSTKVDGAGNFLLTVPSGARTVTIEASGFITFSKEIDLKAGETYDLGPIRLEELVDQGSIKGRVVDVMGDPLLGVIVTLDSGETVTTSDDGTFTFSVEVGNYSVSFARDGFTRVVKEVSVTKDRTTDMGDVEMTSTIPEEEPDNKGIELWQIQLMVFLVIIVVGIAFIYFILKKTRGAAGPMEEE